jgi:cobalt/nickel transport system permease protein
MHMSDALLSPAVGAAFWAGTLGTLVICSKKIKDELDERTIPLMGVMGAFVFATQMVNFAIPGTGSSGHLGGGMILSILLGPCAGFIVMASVLTVQSLFFADGGLLALGCNIWNLAIYPCFIGYLFIYKPWVRKSKSPKRILWASLAGAIAGLQLGAFSVVIQTVLSGRSELPFTPFVLLMLPIHLAIGVVEGFVTAGVVNYVRTVRPELLEEILEGKLLPQDLSLKKLLITFVVLTLITGGLLSWLASSNPDGLEWAVQKVYGKIELPEHGKGWASFLSAIQKKTVLLPDYGFKKKEGMAGQESTKMAHHPDLETKAGSSFSGLLGSMVMIGLILLVGFGLKLLQKKRQSRTSPQTRGN